MAFTIDQIRTNLATDARWAIRAIEVLFSYQTANEQAFKHTGEMNGKGFNKIDAPILSSFAEQIAKRKRDNNPTLLSEKQLAIAYKKLPKYCKQILAHIEAKAAADAAEAQGAQ